MHPFGLRANRRRALNIPQRAPNSRQFGRPDALRITQAHAISAPVSARAPKTKTKLTRRSAVLAGGGVAAAAIVAGAAIALKPRARDISFLKQVDLAGAKALGDGFYEVDGWVLSEADIRRLGGTAPAEDK